jgi:hypothetical protein
METHSFAETFRLLGELETEGVLERYAVVGAVGALFHAEATPTFDLDVAVLVPQAPGAELYSLDPLYRALAARGHAVSGAHVLILGVPVQFLPGDRGLWREVVEAARSMDYAGVPVRVATPEHLVAMAFEAPERRRLERAGALLDSPQFDHAALAAILARHGIPNRSPDRL